MPRPKNDFPPKKEKFIGFKVTEELYDVISKEASEAKMSISEYCRKLATDHKITVHQGKCLIPPRMV